MRREERKGEGKKSLFLQNVSWKILIIIAIQ